MAPPFAGYVTQQYLAKKREGQRRAVDAYERIMRRIPELIKYAYISNLQPQLDSIDYDLGTVPNLYSLVPMFQSSCKPVFILEARDGALGAHFSKAKDVKDILERIASNLERI